MFELDELDRRSRSTRASRFDAARVAELSGPELEAREAIDAHRRQRVLLAVADLAHDGGIGAVTTAEVCRVAQLGPGAFHDLFNGRDHCLQWALLTAHSNLFAQLRGAGVSEVPWYDRVVAALNAFFAQIAAEPLLAELCLTHGETMTEAVGSYEAGRQELEALMAGGREAGRIAAEDDYREPAPELEEFLARAVLWLAVLRIEDGEVKRLPSDGARLAALAAGAFFGIGGTRQRWRELQASCSEPV